MNGESAVNCLTIFFIVCRYYMAMGASKIVAEPLTITGSIGVVTGKFNLEELYRRVQYSKVVISKGKWVPCLLLRPQCQQGI